MSDFLKKFLTEDRRRLQDGATRGVFLGAFGKHPGWDDHVEDIGLETESLIQAKTRLYVQGIGSQIDSGEWEKLDGAQQVPAFKHIFVWQRGKQFLVGRMWSSSDGKGRKRYPMIVCAHFFGVPLAWALDQVLPVLEALERDCLSLATAQEIRRLLEQKRNELRQRLETWTEGAAPPSLPPETVARFVSHPQLGPDQQGWHRLLYQMESQLQAFAPGHFNARNESARAQQIRVPRCGDEISVSLRFWFRFFGNQIDPSMPVLMMVPIEEGWVDVTVGEPTAQEFFSLRASAKKVPLVTEVPYNLDEDFRRRARRFVEEFQRGSAQPAAQSLPDPETTTFFNKPAGGKSKWLKWLVGGAGVVVLLGVVLVFMNNSGQTNSPRGDPALPNGAEGRVSGSAGPGVTRDTAAPPAAVATQEPELEASPPESPSRETEDARAARVSAELEKEKEQLAAAQEEEKVRLEAEARAAAQREREEKERLAALAAEEEKRALEKVQADAKTAEAPTVSVPKAAEASIQSGGASSPTKRTNSLGIELAVAPGGFWAGKYEITQTQYEKVMGSNPSIHVNPDHPVDSVSWRDAVSFCEKLTGLEKEAGSLPEEMKYALPTRAQWESLLAGDSLDQAVLNLDGNRERTTSPVGSAPANRLGLHDVLGNVWEWCLDDAPAGNKFAMGGSFLTSRYFAFKQFQPTSPREESPEEKSPDLGFRCVLIKSE